MEVKLLDKRKRNITVLSILALIFLASGGFLLWRVNQEEELAPMISDAGGENSGCNPGRTCSSSCVSCKQPCYNPGEAKSCGHIVCGGGAQCQCKSGWKLFCPSNGKSCAELCGDKPDDDVSVCSCQGGWEKPPAKACGYNCLFPSVTQSQVNAAAAKECKDKIAMCVEGPPNKVVIQTYDKNHPCYNKYKQCNNPIAFNPCTPPTPPTPPPVTNECDGGNWISKPSGTYAYCEEIKYSFLAKDSDGIDKSSITVKLNGDVRGNVKKTTEKSGDKEVKSEESLLSETNCLEPGEYTIKASWKDKKGATGAKCALTTTFTVLEEVKNPDWNITKKVVESCIDENTENPKARLQYTITVTNKGEGSGQILSIEDKLDGKVLSEYIESIDGNGQFSDGVITWILTEAEGDFAPGQSKSYSYSYSVPSDAFGTYENTVEAKPSEGATLIANATITADCIISEDEDTEIEEEMRDEDLPDAGIFDDGQKSIILGFTLLFLGFTWRLIGKGILFSFKGVTLANERVKKSKSVKRKKKLEKRIIKD